jgi:tetratricopeptide (TPR) repeat protein
MSQLPKTGGETYSIRPYPATYSGYFSRLTPLARLGYFAPSQRAWKIAVQGRYMVREMSSDPASSEEIRRFEEQFRQNPDSLVFARLADAYRKAGDPQRALSLLDEEISRHDDYASAHIVRARALEDLKRPDEAVVAYRRVLDLDGQNLVALRGLGVLASERGDLVEARHWYELLTQVDPLNLEGAEMLREVEEKLLSHPSGEPAAAEEELPAPEEPLVVRDDEIAEEPAAEPLEPEEIHRWARERGKEPDEPVAATELSAEEPTLDTMAAEIEAISEVMDELSAVPDELQDAAAGDEDDEDSVRDQELGMEPEPGGAAASERGAGDSEYWWYEARAPGDSEEELAEADLLTRTMADLYAQQGLYDEALEIYEELVADHPHDADLAAELEALRERAAASRKGSRSAAPETRSRERADAAGSEDHDDWMTEADAAPPALQSDTVEPAAEAPPALDQVAVPEIAFREPELGPLDLPEESVAGELRRLLRAGEELAAASPQLEPASASDAEPESGSTGGAFADRIPDPSAERSGASAVIEEWLRRLRESP